MSVQFGDLRVIKIDANKSKTIRVLSVNNDGSCIVEFGNNLSTISKIESLNSTLLKRDSKYMPSLRRTSTKRMTCTIRKNEACLVKSLKKTKKVKQSNIYLLDMGNDFVKVGRSNKIKRRMKDLNAGAIAKIKLVKSWQVCQDKAAHIETDIKKKMNKICEKSKGGTEVFKKNNNLNKIIKLISNSVE